VGAGLLGTGRACAAPDGGDDLPLGLVALCCGLLNAHTQPQSRTRPCCPRHSTVFHLRPGVFCATNTPCFTFLPAGGGAPAAAAAPSAGGAPAGGAAPAAESKKKEEKKARPACSGCQQSPCHFCVCILLTLSLCLCARALNRRRRKRRATSACLCSIRDTIRCCSPRFHHPV